MDILDKIHEAYKAASSYPDLVTRLIRLGILSYTVDVATGTVLYRLTEGKNVLHPGGNEARIIAEKFDEHGTIKAIRDNQQMKTDYPAFMNQIAQAGVRLYEATLNGPNKRVTYIGTGGLYEEAIPQ